MRCSLLAYRIMLGASLLACALAACRAEDRPRLGYDGDGGRVFEAGGAKYLAWGVDADTWGCDAGNLEHFRKHCEASVYINATVINIPITWKNVERRGPGQYDFTFVDRALEIARAHGLKAILLWVGIDYAAGDPWFIPDYIRDDPKTYTRITGFGYDEWAKPAAEGRPAAVPEERLHCPSCPATLRREAAAYARLMQHLARTDTPRTVLAVNASGEINYLRAMRPEDWTPERDVRCRCRHCDAAFRPGRESNIAFMTRQFARYVKTVIEAGAKHYDIPVYSQFCPHRWFPGWRYAEDPVAFKAIIHRANYFVVPSVLSTVGRDAFVREEMDYFRPACIPGNIPFVDGIDTGWPANLERLEMAPWYTLLHYGGLGAVYWDAPSVSIIKEGEPRRELFRRMWGPLKAMHYHLARHKSAGPRVRFWWGYPDTQSSQEMNGFRVEQRSSDRDYGVCFALEDGRLAVAATTVGGPATVTLTRPGGFAGYRFERGCFDMVTGAWHKAADMTPRIEDDRAVLTLDGDSGDHARAACYVYPEPAKGGDAPDDIRTAVVDPDRVEVDRWEGWGCSLSWWGVYSASWPDAARREVCRRLFSRDADALGMNIARYNAGGTAPDADPKPFRVGGKVVVLRDRDGSFHPERDRAQMECLKLARRFGADRFELFVNAPPWWMLRNGNTRGGDNGGENLKEGAAEEYAAWLLDTAARVEAACGLRFVSLAPFNEPSAGWWDEAKSGQEGCRILWPMQAAVLRALHETMEKRGRRWVVAASDENGAREAYDTLDRLTAPVDSDGRGGGLDRRHIGRVNVHAYYGWEWQNRLRALAAARGIPAVWMSEVSHREWENAGFVPADMRCALPLSRSVISDIRRLRCRAWVYWQPVEPLPYNVWYRYTYGLMQAVVDSPFDWNGKTRQPGEFVVAKSYYAMMQFTRFIRPGSRIIASGDEWTLASLSPDGKRLVLVAHNDTQESREYAFDLRRFARIGQAARAWRTKNEEGADKFDCRPLSPLPIRDQTLRDTIPGRSITTYVLDVASP